ncbi:MAG: biopolymer transporter ExbD [Ignavibacteria bacterium]|nr:biopolymer transporter ExbD [Ignavibacteria bacterium]
MAGTDVGAPDTGQERGGKKYKKPKATGVHIDMTPMVDVIMLLLTFFMLTTTLSAPQLMNINLPKGDINKDRVKLAADVIMFLRVSEKGNIYISYGNADGSETAPEKVDVKQVAAKIENRYAQNENTVLLLRFDRKMKYNVMVDVFDEINRAKITERRYAIQKLEDKDKEIITAAGG